MNSAKVKSDIGEHIELSEARDTCVHIFTDASADGMILTHVMSRNKSCSRSAVFAVDLASCEFTQIK